MQINSIFPNTQLTDKRPPIYFDKNNDCLLITCFTKRLFIRSYLDKDFELCRELYSDKKITRFFDHGEPRTEQEIIEYIKERGRRYFNRGEPYGLFSIFLKEENIFLGQVDLVPTNIPGEVEIGWIFHEKFQKRGFCSEAVLDFMIPLIYKAAELEFKTNNLKINTIIATAHPENGASNRIIEKAGLKFYQSKLKYNDKPRNWYSRDIS